MPEAGQRGRDAALVGREALRQIAMQIVRVRGFFEQRRDAHRLAAVARPRERREPARRRAEQMRAGRGDAAHREGRGVQFVIGAEHQRRAQQIGLGARAHAPRVRDLPMQRLARRRPRNQRRREQAHEDGGIVELRVAALRPDARHLRGGGGQQHQRAFERRVAAPELEPRRPLRRRDGRGGRVQHAARRAFPQQRGDFFERGVARQFDGVLAAIEEPAARDQRDRRFEHRHAPVQHFLRDFARALAVGLAAREAAHFGGIVAACVGGGCVGAVGLRGVRGCARCGRGTEQPAAHIGVKRGAADAEFGGGFGRGHIAGHGGGRRETGKIDLY